jgi:hypothetical protein
MEFIALAQTHHDEASRLCNFRSHLSHSISDLASSDVSGGSLSGHGGDSLSVINDAPNASGGQLTAFSQRRSLLDEVMKCREAAEILGTLIGRMHQYIEDAAEHEGRILQYFKFHLGLCERATKTCFSGSFESKVFLTSDDSWLYDRQVASLSAMQASLERLKLLPPLV